MRFAKAVMVGVGLLLLGTAVAQADNRQAARDSYREGSRLYELQDYRGALEAFKRAYVNFEDPTLLFNIAQCHRYLDHKEDAIAFYRKYVRKAPNSPMAEEVRRLITQLEGALDQDRRANSAPPKGTLPAVSGHSDAHQENATPEARPADTAPVAAVSTSSERHTDRPLLKKWWLWAAVGGGVVVIALGVGLGVGLSQGTSPYPATHTTMTFQF